MDDDLPDDATELVDVKVRRVDLVRKPAHGQAFLIAKSALPTPLDVFPPKETAVTDTAIETPVVKAGDDPTDDLDPTTVLAEPADDTAPGDPNDPGSPAWEAIDAATACKWTAILSRAKNALECLADREAQEAVTADPSDADSVFDLQDAGCAIDYAISILAPFAVGEQIESDLAAEAMSMIGKALAAVDLGPLDVIEGLAPIAKAGRVLSAANEAKIRTAAESLQTVLASLPQAEEAPVSKSTEPTEPATEAEPAAEPVVKAAGDPQMAVFDSAGNLIGTVDPDDLTAIAAPAPPDGGDTTDTADATDPPAADPADTPANDPAAAAPAADPAAAPAVAPDPTADPTDPNAVDPDDAGEPTGGVAKSTEAEVDVVKAIEDLKAEHASVVKSLEDRINALEEQPAPSRVLSNGAVPTEEMLRGQGEGAPIPFAKAKELRERFVNEQDAGKQKQTADEMQALAVQALSEIHGRR